MYMYMYGSIDSSALIQALLTCVHLLVYYTCAIIETKWIPVLGLFILGHSVHVCYCISATCRVFILAKVGVDWEPTSLLLSNKSGGHLHSCAEA